MNKTRFYHPFLGHPTARYHFACRDNLTLSLKPVPKNGSRKKFCRYCPALRLHGKCLFGATVARDKMILLELVSLQEANERADLCRCGQPLDGDYELCTACLAKRRESYSRRTPRQRTVPCKQPGCDQQVYKQKKSSGYCRKCALRRRASNGKRGAEIVLVPRKTKGENHVSLSG